MRWLLVAASPILAFVALYVTCVAAVLWGQWRHPSVTP